MKLYFTFGTDEKFPAEYRNGYIVVQGQDREDCVKAFKQNVPPRDADNPNILNCSDYYTESQWQDVLADGFYHEQPKAVIRSSSIDTMLHCNQLIDMISEARELNLSNSEVLSEFLKETGMTFNEYQLIRKAGAEND